MANVFGILTAIILALAAFIASKNKSAYEASISQLQTQRESLTKSEARLKAAQEVLTALPIERTAVDAEVEKNAVAEAAQKKVNDGLSAQATEKTAKIASNKEKLDGIRSKTESTGNVNELAAKLRATNDELATLAVSIEVATGKLADLTAQNSSTEAQVNASKNKFESFTGGQSLAALDTRIRSIYPNYGFVTLASGNNGGVVANSTLNVERNGEVIAKLLVTAVESTSASASIVPDSLASDVTLRVGDRVLSAQKAPKTPGN